MYQVKGYKKETGNLEESQEFSNYKQCLHEAISFLNSDQYKAIVIVKRGEGLNYDKFFLERIIK